MPSSRRHLERFESVGEPALLGLNGEHHTVEHALSLALTLMVVVQHPFWKAEPEPPAGQHCRTLDLESYS